MSLHRRLSIASGAALLTLALTGCSGLGRTMVGTLTYETGRDVVVRVTSPSVNGCHRLAPSGATRVENATLVDIQLYRTRDCTGKDPIYLATTLTDEIVPGTLPWRSYSVIH
ncbi:hypothetical protein [Streptomyces sp. NPDC051909]|uniref:hypothetical protein n=1 Tax=Streptomyces sp. NPDC051909 TaxID=3154944 RepID=UPI0034460C10